MIDDIDEAMIALQTQEMDVANDLGEDAVEACYFDLVANVAMDCTPEVADELRRRTGAQVRS